MHNTNGVVVPFCSSGNKIKIANRIASETYPVDVKSFHLKDFTSKKDLTFETLNLKICGD